MLGHGTEPANETPGQRVLFPYACLIVAPLLWAGNFVVARAFYADIPPIAFNFWRWFLAFLVLVPFTQNQVRREIGVIAREWKLCALLGIAGIALFQTFSYVAVHTTTALNASLYLSATPLFVIALSSWMFSERLTRRGAVGVGISVFGVILIATRADLSELLQLRFNAGDLWMMAAVPLWAIYSVWIKRCPPDLSARSLLMGSIFFGLVVLVPLYLWELASGARMALGLPTAAALLYVSLFASAIAFLCWQSGVNRVGPNKSSLFVHLIPMFSAILAFMFLREAIWGPHLLGVPFIFLGILMTTSFGRRDCSHIGAGLAQAEDPRS